MYYSEYLLVLVQSFQQNHCEGRAHDHQIGSTADVKMASHNRFFLRIWGPGIFQRMTRQTQLSSPLNESHHKNLTQADFTVLFYFIHP